MLCVICLGGYVCVSFVFFFFQAEDGIRDYKVTGVQTCALPIWPIESAVHSVSSAARDRGINARAADLGIEQPTDRERDVLDHFAFDAQAGAARDRKSTRLNSSHLVISYAVFCLKKKKEIIIPTLNLNQLITHLYNLDQLEDSSVIDTSLAVSVMANAKHVCMSTISPAKLRL